MKKFILIIFAVFVLVVLGLLVIPGSYLSTVRSFEELTIQGDGFQIYGLVSEGEDPDSNWIVLVHGNRKSGQNHELYQTLREALPATYSILAVDLRGFGGSVGDGENQLPDSIDRSEDLATVSDYLIEKYGISQNQIILVGHSFGAAQIFSMAQEQEYLLVVPIGLGNWDALRESESGIDGYIKKFEANTGIRVEESVLYKNAESFTTGSLFSECPQTPARLVYASRDYANTLHFEAFKSLSEECQGLVSWIEVPLTDHMYGTEMSHWPELLRVIYSRISISLLKYHLVQILGSVDQPA